MLFLSKHLLTLEKPVLRSFMTPNVTALCQLVAFQLGKQFVIKITEGISFLPDTDFEDWWNANVKSLLFFQPLIFLVGSKFSRI